MTEFNPGAAASLDQAVKLRYEANADTNAYTDAEKAKLAGIEAGATAGPAPAGSGSEVQYRSGAAFGAAARLSVGAAGNPILGSNATKPPAPPTDALSLYARKRAGADFLEVQRPSGRAFPMQPHFGFNRIGLWSPNTSSNVITLGMPRSVIGSTTTPNLAAGSRNSSSRRWRVTSAASAGSAAQDRSNLLVCWRGDTAGLGGFTYTNRFSLNAYNADSTCFVGLRASGTISASTTLAALTVIMGIGFQAGTHTNWQVVHNDASGSAVTADTGIAINTADQLTLTVFAEPNGSSVWVRLRNEDTGLEHTSELNAEIVAQGDFLAPHTFLNTGSGATAVAFDCSGVYLETDF